jgi:hypothetical protein
VTIAATPEDDNPKEAAVWAELNTYLIDNSIDIEFPDDPQNYAEVMASPDAGKWIEGTHEELKALKDYGVYKLIPHEDVPLNKPILDLKPVYAHKHDMNSTVVWNKVHYCVKGYHQVYGHDYTHTTSPTACLESFCTILHVAVSQGWDIQQINVKTAFLNTDLPPDKYQYTCQPRHFEKQGKETWV